MAFEIITLYICLVHFFSAAFSEKCFKAKKMVVYRNRWEYISGMMMATVFMIIRLIFFHYLFLSCSGLFYKKIIIINDVMKVDEKNRWNKLYTKICNRLFSVKEMNCKHSKSTR